mmetsp:Transcript_4205/g.7501  ORF Transcript_4205/g.7501 Transcript_4205/m.7501 type:complete len:312 (-) Transcript_4205:364-1299(-)|eukprot:CAMPEP_0175075212 /NCGR_PEP_ID=MMETSP0052_2-20121109/21841_1 /TAXON_ID=51329 ORGANISM="Polytomella parva, Strain SAG 63-3" /NCGR_SAMPLE_ID=MMETSP0052_2 /ASSEMBLY_ACC=CAM_ASM_000194 /LENGTH=311 /DNA_ID=CAMNT_0016343805 /DNA_START=126 /DNA_END=1061 /DNA_ORIENTATION=+
MPNELYGVFHEETSIGLNTPYDVKSSESTRFRGKQMLTHIEVSGKASRDAYFDKTINLTMAGDIYIDPSGVEKEISKKLSHLASPHTKPFFPTNPSKKTGLSKGSLEGTFGPSRQLLDTDSVVASRDRLLQSAGPRGVGPRNFYTRPSLEGNGGYPFQYRNIGGTSQTYLPDEYLRGRILEKQLRQTARSKIPKPFVSGKVGDTFSRDANLFANPPLRPATSSTSSRQTPSGENRPKWVPSHPQKKGRGNNGTLSPLVYMSDPETLRPDTAPTGVSNSKAFRPASGGFNRLSSMTVNPYYSSPRRKEEYHF